jgi:beta-1,4-N-acetylglucosaminyltransferase
MIFLTVGTQFPFDRLVKAVDEAVEAVGIFDRIYAQIGESSYRPRNFEAVPSLEKNLFDKYMSQASRVIGHAGMGTIMRALSNNKPLLVMPRRQIYGEAVNDHQVEIARVLEKFKHVLVAYEREDIPAKIELLRSFVPRRRQARPERVAERIKQFLGEEV